MKFNRKTLATVTLLTTMAGSAYAVTEISWWYSNTGALSDRIQSLADQFNKSQSEYKVKAIFKGGYDESMAAAIAAYRAGNAPHILQVFEVGTATMMYSKGAIVPVADLMKRAGEKFDPAAYVPAVAGYYTSLKGDMQSLPFAGSRRLHTRTASRASHYRAAWHIDGSRDGRSARRRPASACAGWRSGSCRPRSGRHESRSRTACDGGV
jgi:ABC-type glycerol-3-phosphate transport system substrate-binding protein